MPKTRPRTAPSDSGSPVAGANSPTVFNEILLSLPAAERALVFPELEFVDLASQQRLADTGLALQYGWFVTSGLASVLSVMKSGKSVEVGLTGKEGFVGLPLVVGLRTSASRIVMQVAGSALRIGRVRMGLLLKECPHLERRLNRYAQEFGLQPAQGAACNRIHSVERRLARWLLMSQDRLGGSQVPLTQNALAQMLGTRRASVSEAAAILQGQGLIQCVRGNITIMDRIQLADAACECYGILIRQIRNWSSETR